MNNFLSILIRVLISTSVAIVFALIVIVLYTNAQLPPVRYLEDVQLQVPLRVYSADGKLIGEYGEKRRTPIKIEEVPNMLTLAILATEDRRFYEHNGVDLRGIGRAAMNLVLSGRKSQGASTITMQVARNFFLTRKKTFGRKLNEILLALKIEKELPKARILELYLNKIYFGKRAYGVQAAAQVYYGTTVDKLTLAQMAMLAGLPQAPSAINPINNPDAALKRRSHVLKRMLHYRFIDEKQFEQANAEPLMAGYHGRSTEIEAPYVSELVRRELVDRFGPDVYTSGYVAYATIDSRLQSFANNALHTGLLEYDKRHGYRGAVSKLPLSRKGKYDREEWLTALKKYPVSGSLVPAAVTQLSSQSASAILPHGETITLSFDSMQWARPQLTRLILGEAPRSIRDVVNVGDIIYVEHFQNQWRFSQIPEIEGAIVTLHPKNGAILALVGGFDVNFSHFNRATQATRQPGSNFKPFIYAAALEHGYTAASIINDAPIVFYDENNNNEAWRPQNDSRRFYGPTRLRVGLTKSRNLVSIRLLQALGINTALKVIRRFGFTPQQLPRTLSLALGTATVSPLEITSGYATFANGGYKVNPHVLLKVVDHQGKVIYEANPPTVCPECQQFVDNHIDPTDTNNTIDKLVNTTTASLPTPTAATQIITPQTAYIMTSILQDAIQTGTGSMARALNRHDLAGKTGTTNNQMDAWYTGYNSSLVTGVWVGFDEPRSVQEYGSQAALPIWMKFMGSALQGIPETYPTQPRGIVTVKIDPATGLLARPGQPNAIFEIFKQENAPRRTAIARPLPDRGYGRPRYYGGYGNGYYSGGQSRGGYNGRGRPRNDRPYDDHDSLF